MRIVPETRVMLVWAAAATFIGCVLPGMEGGGDGAGGGQDAQSASSGPATACEQVSASCEDCINCALAEPCAAVVEACNQDPLCYSLSECVAYCGQDGECIQACYYQSGGGAELYGQALACLYCTNCPQACVGRVSCY